MNFKLNNVAFLPFLAVIFLISNSSPAYELPVNTGAVTTGEISVISDVQVRNQNNLLSFDPFTVVACVPMNLREIETEQRAVSHSMGLNEYSNYQDYDYFLQENPLKYVVLGIPEVGRVRYNYAFNDWRIDHAGNDILSGLKTKLLQADDKAQSSSLIEIDMTTDKDLFPAIWSNGRFRQYSETTAWNSTDWHRFNNYGSGVKLRVNNMGHGEIVSNDNKRILFVLKCKGFDSGSIDNLNATLGIDANVYDFVLDAYPWADN